MKIQTQGGNVKIFKWLILLSILFYSCGRSTKTEDVRTRETGTQAQIDNLKDQILQLQGTQAQINALVNSDFATCPTSGNTANPLINTMCKVAQYATNEQRVLLEGEIGTWTKMLGDQIQNLDDSLTNTTNQETSDVATINASITAINTSITSINANIATLQTQMTSANTAIATLQTQINGAIGTINGAMTTVSIGAENISAGPFFESILRSTDKSKVNAYVQASTQVALSNNALTATNGSTSIKITLTTHGYLIGDSLYFTGLVGSKGLSNEDVNGLFMVASVVDANNFTITVCRQANASGAFGGTTGTVKKITGQGLATVWTTASGADTVVRTTSVGSKPYNFIITATGDVCYDMTNNAQVFATIAAKGTNIVCK